MAGLLGDMPVSDPSTAARIARTREMQLQRAAQTAYSNPSAVTPGSTSAAAGQVAAQTGAAQVQASQQTAQRGQQMGQLALGQAQLGQQASAFNRDIATSQIANANEAKIAQMSSNLRRDLVERRTNIARDQAGRIVLNEAQRADLAVLLARSENELRDFVQEQEQATSKHVSLLKIAHNRLTQEMSNKTDAQIQEMNQARGVDLYKAKADMEAAIREAEAKKANKSMMVGAVLGVAGGVVGGYFGGPMGAAAGAQGGMAFGNALAQGGYV